MENDFLAWGKKLLHFVIREIQIIFAYQQFGLYGASAATTRRAMKEFQTDMNEQHGESDKPVRQFPQVGGRK